MSCGKEECVSGLKKKNHRRMGEPSMGREENETSPGKTEIWGYNEKQKDPFMQNEEAY